MANSINTNAGALVALQNLNATSRDLNVTQNRVNTGLKISSAKDNGAIFAIATAQRAEMGAQDAVKQSLQRGQSIVDVALSAGETVTNAMNELKSLAVAIQDAAPLSDTANKLNADFSALVAEIKTSLADAKFDGVNLYAANAAAIDVTTNTSGGKFTLKSPVTAAAGAYVVGGLIDPTQGAAGAVPATEPAFDLDTLAHRTAANVERAIANFSTVLADLGTKSKSLDRQLTFTSKMQDALEVGIGNLVDAD